MWIRFNSISYSHNNKKNGETPDQLKLKGTGI